MTSSSAIRLLGAAAVVAVVHAAFSLSWALRSTWLLPTVGQWAVRASRERPLTTGVVLVAVSAVKLGGGLLPVVWAGGRPPRVAALVARSRWVRASFWAGALVLVVYGALNTLGGWLVLAGAVHPGGGVDREAALGHAVLWDPLFLLWGVLLALGLREQARGTRRADQDSRPRQ